MITDSINRFDTVNLTPDGPIVNQKTGTNFSEEIRCTGIRYRNLNAKGERRADFVKTINYGHNTPLKQLGIDTVEIKKDLNGQRKGRVLFIKDNELLKSFSLGDTKAMREFITSLKSKIRP